MLVPGLNLPQRLVAWIDAPAPDLTHLTNDDAAVSRPMRGYKPGDPTPAAATAVPTVKPYLVPTRAPTQAPAAIAQVPSLTNLRWAGTGVISSGGEPVVVHRAPGVDNGDDPQLADGSPVLVSVGPPLQVGTDQWRAIRGLNGVVGWVPSGQLAVDGETPIVAGGVPTPGSAVRTARQQPSGMRSAGVAAAPTGAAARGVIANTDGAGVVLRNSPSDADRIPSGLMDGTAVTVLEASGTDWVHVHADNGQTGWIPAQYVVPTS